MWHSPCTLGPSGHGAVPDEHSRQRGPESTGCRQDEQHQKGIRGKGGEPSEIPKPLPVVRKKSLQRSHGFWKYTLFRLWLSPRSNWKDSWGNAGMSYHGHSHASAYAIRLGETSQGALCSGGQPLLPALLAHFKSSLTFLCQCQIEGLLQILVQLVEDAKSSGDVDPGA